MSNVDPQSFLVTGASSGIGLATADALLGLGGSVTVAARSEAKAQPVIDSLKAKHPGARLDFLLLDLADLAATKRSAETFLGTGRPLDVLINNAGVAGARGLTVDGFDITVGTDFLGPYLFTKLLLPRLKAAAQGRIVNVASAAHYSAKGIDWATLTRSAPSARKALTQYSYAKLMNVLHAKELARQLTGTKITTYALHPGVVASDAWRELPGPIAWVMKLFMINLAEGAKTSVYCATDPALATVTGKYYEKCAEKRPSRSADDEALAKELFGWAEKAIAEKVGGA